MKKRVVVTGGAGLLGSHFWARPLEEEYEVLCVDNDFAGTRRTSEPLQDRREFEAMRHDVMLPSWVEVDEIYDLACLASPKPLPARPCTSDGNQRARRNQYVGLQSGSGRVFCKRPSVIASPGQLHTSARCWSSPTVKRKLSWKVAISALR